ncbi:MAG: 1-deoxy-D-xylulose-5-phosphate reductoisomerase [Gammaproteobacteria bacterium TMED112]|nr:MAG: 1-deoxy-D-xylulose-5-phosphate reductoisomerase [Gammaproteobacteria bacterium TMED112]|tara:strand:+ start:2782 stop:3927 length:1146 start_codon:yes stop_codon:yes gene_type:complete
MTRISMFGFTGSIGTQALSVIEKYQSKFELDVIVCNKNINLAVELIGRHNPKNVFVTDADARSEIMASCSSEINFFDSMHTLRQYLKLNKSDIYLSAVSSFDCIDLTIEAAKSGKKLLLANKEALVVFGKQIMHECKQAKTEVIPIDSEHFSLFTALKNKDLSEISKIYLTASGGPFVGQKLSELHNKTPEEALKHPNWDMGAKISVDSATLVNKCFELIEAKHLFSLGPELLDIKIHRQSVIHSMLEFKDGSVEAQMSQPSMIIPLAYGLLGGYSQDIKKDFSLDLLNRNIDLSLEQFPDDRKKLRDITLDVMNSEDNSGLVFATLNDIAVKKFLNKKIKFGDIYNLILDNYYLIDKKEVNSIQELESNRIEILNLIDGK